MSNSCQTLSRVGKENDLSLDSLPKGETRTFSSVSHVPLAGDERYTSSPLVDSGVTGTGTSNRSPSFASYAQEPVDSQTPSGSRPGADEERSSSTLRSSQSYSSIRDHNVILSTPKNAISFKQDLFKKLNDEVALFTHLHGGEVEEDIVLLQDRGTKYIVLRADDLLDHPGTREHDEETGYIQIEWTPTQKSQKVTQTQKLKAKQRFCADLPKHPFTSEAEGDFFLPLGWFVETNASGLKRATRYVCMLNISTVPMSLWLMFDYLTKDDEDKIINIPNLTFVYDDDIYGFNPGFCTMTSAKSLIGSKDLLLVYKDAADWNPTGSDFATTACGSLLKNLSFYLGPSTQAIGAVPPKSLLDNVTATGLPCHRV